MYTNSCKNPDCRKIFNSQRGDAKYCSSRCRSKMSYARRHAVETPKEQAWSAMNDLARLLDDKHHNYDAVVTMTAIRDFCNMMLPKYDSWWLCRGCHTKVQKPLPDDKDCKCNTPARWVLLNTKTEYVPYEKQST